MKLNKIQKLGVSLFAVTALGVVANIMPTTGSASPTVVYAAEGGDDMRVAHNKYNPETDSFTTANQDDYILQPTESFAVQPYSYEGYEYAGYAIGLRESSDDPHLSKIKEGYESRSSGIPISTPKDRASTPDGYGRKYYTLYYVPVGYTDPKDPSQDPANNGNANTGGGTTDNSSNGAVTPPANNSNGGDNSAVTPPADNSNGGDSSTVTPPSDSTGGGTAGDSSATPPADNANSGGGSSTVTPPSNNTGGGTTGDNSATPPADNANSGDSSSVTPPSDSTGGGTTGDSSATPSADDSNADDTNANPLVDNTNTGNGLSDKDVNENANENPSVSDQEVTVENPSAVNTKEDQVPEEQVESTNHQLPVGTLASEGGSNTATPEQDGAKGHTTAINPVAPEKDTAQSASTASKVTSTSSEAKAEATQEANQKILPKTGEQSSLLSSSLAALTLGMAGILLKKNRHQTKRSRK